MSLVLELFKWYKTLVLWLKWEKPGQWLQKQLGVTYSSWKDSWLQWCCSKPMSCIQTLWRSWNDPCSLQRNVVFNHCKGVPSAKHFKRFRNPRVFNCASQHMLKEPVCTDGSHPSPPLCTQQLWCWRKCGEGGVNFLFTSVNKIRYKLPCFGPPLTSAVNSKEPPFPELQEFPVSGTKFQGANALAKASVWIFPTAVLFMHRPGALGCATRARHCCAHTCRALQTPPATLGRLAAVASISWNQGTSSTHFWQGLGERHECLDPG